MPPCTKLDESAEAQAPMQHLQEPVNFMTCDLKKHPETNNPALNGPAMIGMMYVTDGDKAAVQRRIEGFRWPRSNSGLSGRSANVHIRRLNWDKRWGARKQLNHRATSGQATSQGHLKDM
jgi:hypothetical protein